MDHDTSECCTRPYRVAGGLTTCEKWPTAMKLLPEYSLLVSQFIETTSLYQACTAVLQLSQFSGLGKRPSCV
jgi:hypothetical protein